MKHISIRKQLIGDVRKICFELYKWSCGLCFHYNPKYLELEEIAGRLRGNDGADAIQPENCIPLCRDCHTMVDRYGRAQREEGMTKSKKMVREYLRLKKGAVRACSTFQHRGDYPNRVINPMLGDRMKLIGIVEERLKQGITAQDYLINEIARYLRGIEEDYSSEEHQLLKQWREMIQSALDKREK